MSASAFLGPDEENSQHERVDKSPHRKAMEDQSWTQEIPRIGLTSRSLELSRSLAKRTVLSSDG